MHLFETHRPVADTARSRRFYTDTLNLTFAHHEPTRDIVFLWAHDADAPLPPPQSRTMLGLWGPGSTWGTNDRAGGDRRPFLTQHIALAVPLDRLLAAGTRLNSRVVQTRNFQGQLTTEPSVIAWMPSAQLYFHDPDGHSLELITMLDDPPRPHLGVVTWSQWRNS